MAPLVSFVIPSYNYAPYLRECIDSALSQEGGFDLEVVVADDASTDGSPDIIRSYTDPRVRAFFHDTNRGHVVNINRGFAEARGQFVARIDSDDRCRPTFLREALDAFERHPEAGVVYGDVLMIDGTGRPLGPCPTRHDGRETCGSEFAALLEENFIAAPTVLARRRAWDDALPIPAGLGFSDWYLTLRMAREWPFCYVPKVLADYRIHPQNLHAKMIADRSEETTVMRLLPQFLGGAPSGISSRRVYGSNYRRLADNYFGLGLFADARRCYLRALAGRPELAFDAGILRRLAGTLAPGAYAGLKRLLTGR
jgi:glycosyltransferase involved in cell wall biosynthesis